MISNKKSQQIMSAFLSIILLFTVIYVGTKFSANADIFNSNTQNRATATDATFGDDEPQLMSESTNSAKEEQGKNTINIEY
ncbi:MAG: hypothetical protein ACI4EF_06840, partial [Coprococcus sp.]